MTVGSCFRDSFHEMLIVHQAKRQLAFVNNTFLFCFVLFFLPLLCSLDTFVEIN
uniref:Uncharacterized protein n=1 Tax=Mus musculus TaxID=10090 RepID=Q3TQD0_MOUSE|nr:unnamed protein product [Mus musculus]